MLTPRRGLTLDHLLSDWRVISAENQAEIRRLHRVEGTPVEAIARRLGMSKNTVETPWACDEPPEPERPPRGSAVDEFESRIRELLAEFSNTQRR